MPTFLGSIIRSHNQLSGVTDVNHHTATDAQLDTLTDGSVADLLHSHVLDLGLETIEKSANESISDSVTLQNDDHLLLAIPANETWLYDLVLRAQSVNNESMRIDFAIPSGAVGGYVVTLNNTSAQFEEIIGTVYLLSFIGTDGYYHIKMIVINGGTAGNVQFQWAQRISGATATIVKAGSSMRGTRI